MSKKFSFLDFYDCCQVYFDCINSSILGIRHISSISDQSNDLNSIASSIENSTENLKKLCEKYLELSKKEGDNNE